MSVHEMDRGLGDSRDSDPTATAVTSDESAEGDR